MFNIAPHKTQNITQNVDYNSLPAFKGSYAQNLKIANELMQKMAAEQIEQPNKLGAWINSPFVKFRDEVERSYFVNRANFSGFKLEALREYIEKSPISNYDKLVDLCERLVLLTKCGLCGELSKIMNKWLLKAGVESFTSKPCSFKLRNFGKLGPLPMPSRSIDHRFVVIRDSGGSGAEEVGSLLGDPSAIVVDPLLNRVFVNAEEALNLYERLYGLKKHYVFGDVTYYKNNDSSKSLTKNQKRQLAKCEDVFQRKMSTLRSVVVPLLKQRRKCVREEMFQESLKNGFADYKEF